MDLRATPTSKCLDKKLTMLGFEVLDLLLIFFTISILNFIFGKTNFKFFLVWLPSIALILTLKIGKRGKPESFLAHFLRFYFKPKHLSAFHEPSHWTPPPAFKKGANDRKPR
jgi:hypothetical protein